MGQDEQQLEPANADEWRPAYQRLLGPGGLHYCVLCWAYLAGTVARLTLPDATREDALAISAVWLLGALLVGATRRVEGWLLCLLAAGTSLLTNQDQLTQSALLGVWAGSASLAYLFGSTETRKQRLNRDLPLIVGVVGVLTYLIASLHKLNSGFFNPALSCANGGVQVLGESWQLAWFSELASFPGWAPIFVGMEVGLAVLWLTRPRWALPLAVAMHLPLTVVFAPSFAFVMMVAWVALTPPGRLRHIARVARRRWWWVLGGGLVLAMASISRHSVPHLQTNWLWTGKEALLWVVLVLVLVATVAPEERPVPRRSPLSRLQTLSTSGRAILIGAVVVWLGNGITPYLGLEYHHSGAMLSNLRIDGDCWNSYWAPRAIRLRDPYVRIDEARVRMGSREPPNPSAQQKFSEVVPRRLYSPARLWRLRETWCKGDRVIALGGSYDGARIETANLCDPAGWPLEEPPLLEGYRGFQKNLSADCEQACIH